MPLINESFTAANPLISFNSIIDLDIALIDYIVVENRVIDTSIISDKSYFQFLSEIYMRKYKNPLYYFSKSEKDKADLDALYKSIMQDKEVDILKHSIATEVYNLLLEFYNEPDINPTILYYTDAQKDYIEDETYLQKIDHVSLQEAKENMYSQFFFKDIEEIDPFKAGMKNSTIYFASSGLNLNDKNEDIIMSNEDIASLLYRNNRINLYDMYNMSIIGGNTVDDDE